MVSPMSSHLTEPRFRASQPVFEPTAAAVRDWAARPDVLGVLHVGSKSRGHGDERSDDDLEVLLTDDAFAALAPAACHALRLEGEPDAPRMIWDAQYLARSELARKARSHVDLDRWPYERAVVLFDREGMLPALVAAVAAMPPEFRRARLLHGGIDAVVNARRAQKARVRGQSVAMRLLIARSATALTRVLFALEGRWAPLDHWLEAELPTLAHGGEAATLLVEGVRDAEPDALVRAFETLADRLAAEGFPTDRGARTALFLELIHPSRAAERALHGLI